MPARGFLSRTAPLCPARSGLAPGSRKVGHARRSLPARGPWARPRRWRLSSGGLGSSGARAQGGRAVLAPRSSRLFPVRGSVSPAFLLSLLLILPPQDLRQVQGRQPPGRRGPWDFVVGALRPPSLLLPRAPCSSAASSPTRDGRSCDRRRQRRRSQSVSGGSLSVANGWPRGREASVQPPLPPGPLFSPSDRWIITEISA